MTKPSLSAFISIFLALITASAICVFTVLQSTRNTLTGKSHYRCEREHFNQNEHKTNSHLNQYETDLIFEGLAKISTSTDYAKYNPDAKGSQAASRPGVSWMPSHLAASTPRELSARTDFVLESLTNTESENLLKERLFLAFLRTGASFHWLKRFETNFERLNLQNISFRTPFESAIVYGNYIEYYSPDLSGLHLKNSNFHSADLSGSFFYGSDLSGIDFANAKLLNCDFTVTDLSDSNFIGADLSGSILQYANLPNASAFTASDLRDVDFTYAIVPNEKWLEEVSAITDKFDDGLWNLVEYPDGVGDGWGDHTLYRVSTHRTSGKNVWAILPVRE